MRCDRLSTSRARALLGCGGEPEEVLPAGETRLSETERAWAWGMPWRYLGSEGCDRAPSVRRPVLAGRAAGRGADTVRPAAAPRLLAAAAGTDLRGALRDDGPVDGGAGVAVEAANAGTGTGVGLSSAAGAAGSGGASETVVGSGSSCALASASAAARLSSMALLSQSSASLCATSVCLAARLRSPSFRLRRISSRCSLSSKPTPREMSSSQALRSSSRDRRRGGAVPAALASESDSDPASGASPPLTTTVGTCTGSAVSAVALGPTEGPALVSGRVSSVWRSGSGSDSGSSSLTKAGGGLSGTLLLYSAQRASSSCVHPSVCAFSPCGGGRGGVSGRVLPAGKGGGGSS